MSNRYWIISLFENPKPAQSGIASMLVSSSLHGLGLGMLGFSLLHVPRIREPLLSEHYSVRHLDLHSSELRTDADSPYYPHIDPSDTRKTKDDSAEEPPSLLPELPDASEAKQTLVQPDLHNILLAEEAPIPTLMIWTPEQTSTRHLVAPLPDKAALAMNPASLDAPNHELDLGELAISSALMPSGTPAPSPATTMPLGMRADSPLATATVFNWLDQPTPTALLSISDLRMIDGALILPPLNQTRLLSERGALLPESTAEAYGGAQPSDTGMLPALNARESRTTQHIQLPKDGKFGVVVVGSSLSEVYPQTLRIWNNRVAYTAYLHMGLTRNWILQYAQPRQAEATENGNVARLEAPWPYDMLRPNLQASDLNANALMVHGILNEAGQLESLAVAFPQQFSQAAFVLRALEKWQFRPALRQGKPTAVEVLLIIPEELD